MALQRLLGNDDWAHEVADRVDLVVASVHAALLEAGFTAIDQANGNAPITDARLLREWHANEVAGLTYRGPSSPATVTTRLIRMGDVVVVNVLPNGDANALIMRDFRATDFVHSSVAADADLAAVTKGFLSEKFNELFKVTFRDILPRAPQQQTSRLQDPGRPSGSHQPPYLGGGVPDLRWQQTVPNRFALSSLLPPFLSLTKHSIFQRWIRLA